LVPYSYDPEAARAALAAAGYPDGFTTEMLTNTDPTSISVAQAILADWSAIGVEATITSIDNAQFLDILINQPETIKTVMTSWYLDYLDPSNVFEPLIQCGGSYNWGGYCSETLDATFAEINLLPPGEARWAAFGAFEADIFAETPVAYLYHLNNYYFRADSLDIVADASTLLRFDRATRR